MTVAGKSGSPFRLLQLSDCHLPADPGTLYRGQNADEGLQRLLKRVAEFRPQQILLTGDLSEDGSEGSYRRLRHYLDEMGAPVCALPGNHDVDEVMQRHFPAGPWNGPKLLTAGGQWALVLMRSSRAGRIDGEISEQDLDVLDGMLVDARPEAGLQGVVVALHHQPVPVNAPWIDRYGLAKSEAFLALIERRPAVRAVVWGHVHQPFQARLGGAQLLACPSTAVNSLPETPKFHHDPAGPAGRWFKLHADGEMETGLLRA